MKIKQINRVFEKKAIVGLLTDKIYLSIIKNKIPISLWINPYAKIIVKWIYDYFEKYEDCPINEIQKIYELELSKGVLEAETMEQIENVLIEANRIFLKEEKPNTQFLLDISNDYFNGNLFSQELDKAIALKEEGEITKAFDVVNSINSVQLNSSNGTDPLLDEDKMKLAFSQVAEPIMYLEGDFGKMINEHLCRDSFVVLQAPEKSGKTFFLMKMVIEALKQGLKVAMFQLGDMTEAQSLIRMSIAIAGRSNKDKYCHQEFPKEFINKETMGNEISVEDIRMVYRDLKPLNAESALKSIEKFYNFYKISKEQFRMVTVPASTMNVAQIDAELESLSKQGFVPDFVCLDYMDILAPESYKDIGRDKINNNWIKAKSLVNKRHILLVSATQASAKSYSGELQTREAFSEDKRKYAHTNCTIAFSQTPEEKRKNLMKMNFLVVREGSSNETDVCYLLQSLARGNPIVDSYAPHLYHNYKENKVEKKTIEEKKQLGIINPKF